MTKTTLALIGIIVLGSDPTRANAGNDECQKRFMTVFNETFSGGGNEGAWSLSTRGLIESDGGHPGAFLRDRDLVTFAPWGQTEWGVASLFTGDYRAQDVSALAADFRVFSATWSAEGRAMSLMLVSDAGTPQELSDDLFVYYVGADNIPLPGQGWVDYRFDVPSDSPGLPFPRSLVAGEPGWVAARGDVFTPAPDPDAAWNTVIQDVDQVIFWFHDPRFFAFIQDWDVGMDNPSITTCSETSVSK
jgi:hypothetical protein